MSNLTQEKIKLILHIGDALSQGEQHGRVRHTPAGRYNEAFYWFNELHLQDIKDITGIRDNQIAQQCMDDLIGAGVLQVDRTLMISGTPYYAAIQLTDEGQRMYAQEKL